MPVINSRVKYSIKKLSKKIKSYTAMASEVDHKKNKKITTSKLRNTKLLMASDVISV